MIIIAHCDEVYADHGFKESQKNVFLRLLELFFFFYSILSGKCI